MNFEIRRHYVAEFTKLNLWYVKRLLYLGVGFKDAMQRYTNVYRMTSLFDGNKAHQPVLGWDDPSWEGLLSALKSIYDKYPGHLDGESTAELEREGLAFLWPCLERRIETEAEACQEKRPYGCFSYTSPPAGYLSLHFFNAVAPESPFNDMPALAVSLRILLADFEEKHPGISQVRCSSWLNAFTPFLGLFPPVWRNSRKALGPDSADGAWGQFMDRTGDFHRRNAAIFRRTGKFPYAYSRCECDTSELKDWLGKKDEDSP